MAVRFPQTPALSGFNAPMRLEGEIRDVEVEGVLPDDLDGTWYRIGPDPQYPPYRGDEMWVNSDGMASYFRIRDGHVDYKSRYIRTERFQRERAARQSLYGDYRNVFTDQPSVQFTNRSTSNTKILWHGGKLLCLKEDGRPVEIDPHTLATKGVWDFHGRLKSMTMTAHPIIDPETGELFFFGYEAGGEATRDVAFCVADKEGRLIREEWFEVPYTSFMHDFAVTREHIIFPVFPTTTDLERMKDGKPRWIFDPSKDSFVGIMPRNGSVKDMRWIRRPACFSFHVLNGFSEGNKGNLDLFVSEVNSFIGIPSTSPEPIRPEQGAPFLTRWTIDPSSNEHPIEERILSPLPGELPTVADKDMMTDYEFGFYGAIDPSKPLYNVGPMGPAINMLVRINVKTGQPQTYYPGEGATFHEPMHVPSKKPGHAGYIFTVIDRLTENRSDGAIFDAADIERGPIALLRMPIRLRQGIHGSWVPRDELPPTTDWD